MAENVVGQVRRFRMHKDDLGIWSDFATEGLEELK